jgi:XRE family transcriptional regulator, regulator of sulfur utilization
MNSPSLLAATSNIARMIKAHREARGWSLGALARQTGLSKTLLSRLESGTGNPSLETLWRLATAFDIALGTLLGEHDPPAIRVIRAEDGPTLTSDSGLSARLVLSDGREHRSEIYEAGVPAGSDYVNVHAPGTEELVFCLDGALEVGPQGLEEELSAGDAVWFPGDLPHRYRSRGGAHVLSIMSYPPATRR